MGQGVGKQSLFWIYLFYPVVIFAQLAQYCFGLLKFWLSTGTIPYLDHAYAFIYDCFTTEVFGWCIYIPGFLLMGIIQCLSLVVILWLPLIAHFWIGYDPGEATTTLSHAQCSCQQWFLCSYNVGLMCLSSYCLYPWFHYLTTGYIHKYYMCLARALDIGYKSLTQFSNTVLSHVRPWPPDGIITGALLFIYMLLAQCLVLTKLVYHHSSASYLQSQIIKHGTKFIFFLSCLTDFRGSFALFAQPSLATLTTFVYNASEAVNSTSFTFDSDSVPVVIDNSANTHIWSRFDDFLEGSMSYFADDEAIGVVTIDDNECRPIARGTVIVSLFDDSNVECSIKLEEALYFPDSPVNVIGVTRLAEQLGDENGTWIKTRWRRSTFAWDHEKHFKTFSHSSNKLPVINVRVGFTTFASFYSLFENAGATYPLSPLQTCRAALPLDYQSNLCFVTDDTSSPSLDHSKHHFSSVLPEYDFEDKAKLIYNGGVCQNVEIVGHTLDTDTGTYTYKVLLNDGSTMSVEKEFLSAINEPDLFELPLTLADLQPHIDKLDPATVEALLNPEARSPLVSDFIGWHIRAGHLPFADMAKLSEHGYLPKHFKTLATSKKIVCPSCVFGKSHRKPWRTKGQAKSIR